MTFPPLERRGPREGMQSRSVQEVRRPGLVNLQIYEGLGLLHPNCGSGRANHADGGGRRRPGR